MRLENFYQKVAITIERYSSIPKFEDKDLHVIDIMISFAVPPKNLQSNLQFQLDANIPKSMQISCMRHHFGGIF